MRVSTGSVKISYSKVVHTTHHRVLKLVLLFECLTDWRWMSIRLFRFPEFFKGRTNENFQV